jgi:predicted amidohydrolase YtcJ
MKSILFALSALLFYITLQAQTPEMILTNGKIFTSDTANLYVEALAVKNGRIVATGTTAKVEKMATPGTKKIDLKGMLVVPGFNDAHNHLPDGLRVTKINLPGMDPSWQMLADSLTLFAAKVPKGQWIEATIGISIANSPAVNRFVLDKIAHEHPVRLLSFWGHVGIYNTLGMQKMGIALNQADPKSGFYERLPDGKTLTGRAFEKNAYWPHTSYNRIAAMRDEKALVQELQGMTQAMLRLGITSVQNMCTGASSGDYIKFWKRAGLPFRLRLIKWADMNADGSLSIPSKELPKNAPGMPLLTVSGTKWLLEGTPLEQGAEQIDAYPNRPNWHGRMNYTIPEIERMCRDAIARKDQIHFHLGGSRSIGKVLDMMATMNVDWKPLRPRFEHGDEIDYAPEYLQKARRMGVIIVQNPTHFAPITGMPQQPPATHGMALKSLLKAGIPLAIGSDGPFDPFLNIMLATTHPMRPSEALTREQAVIAYTRTAAYAEFEEQNKGTLAVGKVADLAVLSQDIFASPQVMGTQSVLTMVNGKVVYDSGLLKLNR